MAMPSSSPPDPPSTTATSASAAAAATTTTTTTTTTTPRLFPNPRPPISLPQPHYTVQSQQQQQQQPPPLYTVQSLSNIAPRGPTTTIRPQLAKSRDPPPPGILYPVASSGRGFLPRAIRPQLPDQTVTIAANPGGGGFPPRPVMPYPHPVRGYGLPHSDPHPGQSVHLIKPTHLQHTLVGSTGGVVKGVPVSTHPKVAPPPPPSSVSDCNGYKDIRDRNRDDNFSTVRDRKVRISDDASLYALCRSWLRNGFPEEIQPQYMDGVKSLPRPLPISVGEAHSPVKKESDKEEEDEGLVEHLSTQELLQSHIKRAKRVRARLREERLKRIARYKTRLALLLPPIVEQQLRNDTAAGN